jgi:hypothetical protein
MVPIRKKREGKVPIAFMVDPENENFIVSIPREVIALRYVYKLCKNPNYSYGELADWYEKATGKKIARGEISYWRHGKRTPLAVKI